MKQVENATGYVLDDEGYIRNQMTGQKLKRYWAHSRSDYWSRVTADDGRVVRVWHTDPIARPEMDSESLSDLLAIPDYPDYKITPYGAVWRVKGKRLRQPVLMAQHTRFGKEYVQLRTPAGQRHNKRVSDLLAQATELETETA